MHTDVENKLLYVNDDGRVTDKKGNVLDDYSYVGVVSDVEGDENLYVITTVIQLLRNVC